MNEFTKQWITSTLAPESIINIKSDNNKYIDIIRNESNTIHVIVLSNDTQVESIAKKYEDLTYKPQSFRDVLNEIAKLLEITSITIN